MNDIINDVMEMSTDKRLDDISFSIQVAPQLPKVEVDIIQIQQVLLNLIRNALDATELKENAAVSVNIEALLNYSNRSMIRVCDVSDNGSGLSDELRKTYLHPLPPQSHVWAGYGARHL